jgi:hypothetical protein
MWYIANELGVLPKTRPMSEGVPNYPEKYLYDTNLKPWFTRNHSCPARIGERKIVSESKPADAE